MRGAEKATKRQVREHNRRLVLQAVIDGRALNRAALALETGLAKPTISDLVTDLIDDGFLEEEGYGESTESGGKRPRLLRFRPDARHVIGISITPTVVQGILTHLDGRVLVEHQADVLTDPPDAVLRGLTVVIYGLMAQMSAPLLSMSLGVPGDVDAASGTVHSGVLGWRDVPLGRLMSEQFGAPVLVSESTELAARALYAARTQREASNLLTLLISDTVGLGAVLGGDHALGHDIGHLPLHDADGRLLSAAQALSWPAVCGRAAALGAQYRSPALTDPALTYLRLRYAAARGDAGATALLDELAGYTAEVLTWSGAFFRPDMVVLAGPIGSLGELFFRRALDRVRARENPWAEHASFAVEDSEELVALGACAKVLALELGRS